MSGRAARSLRARAYGLSLLFVETVFSFARADLVAHGALTADTVWSGPVQVEGTVTVPAGFTLTVAAGADVKLAAGVSVSAQAGGAIIVAGTVASPVLFQPQAGTTRWGNLSASGHGASVTLQHAELAFGGVDLSNQATGLIEDTYVHDVSSAIVGNSAQFVTLRRVHVKNYSETIFNSGTVILAEDSLFEHMTAANSDALEIQGGPPGSIIRRCTFRHSTGGNSDALDFNSTSGVLVQDCLIYDFTDKGISLGAAGTGGQPDRGIIVSNCCIYRVDTGIAVKDGTTCALFHNTIAASATGWRLYQKYTSPVDGGHVTNSTANIVWGNGTGLNLADNSSIVADHSNFQGTNWPGDGNLSVNPLFVDAAGHDYRLAANSPGRGAGRDGADLGARFPVGAPMAPSHPGFSAFTSTPDHLALHFWVDSSGPIAVLANDSLTDGGWFSVTNALPGTVPRQVVVTLPVASARRFYRLSPGVGLP